MWLGSLLEELHMQLDDKTVLWCDNSNAVLHSRHVELDLYFVLGRVAAGKLIFEVHLTIWGEKVKALVSAT